MSIKFSFKDDKFSLDKLLLPTRYYYFDESENYIKLLSIGEGIFPKDKIKISFNLKDSNLILTNESATKIYPSSDKYGILNTTISLQNSNLEYLNDELILYKDSKFLQFFRLNFDEKSTFFYSDILTDGRSFENFDFTNILIKNSFYQDKNLEYIEKFDVNGKDLKDYIKRHNTKNSLYLKFYIKTKNNEIFLEKLYEKGFKKFVCSSQKNMIIGSYSFINMDELKKMQKTIWQIYRDFLDKKEFELGKF